MKNVTATVAGDILTLTINLKERHGESASGKTKIVATTGGNVPVEGHPEIKIGVNAFTK